MNNKKLQFLEIAAFMYFFMRSSFLGIGIETLLHHAKVDIWISVIIGTILGLIYIFFLNKVSDIAKEKTINEIMIKILGKKIGKIVCIIFMLFVFFYGSILFYDLVNFISSEYLYQTPPLLVGIMLLIPIIYLSSKGLKTMARTSVIIFMLSLILYIFSMFGLLPNFHLLNFLPCLENGLKPPVIGSLYHLAYITLPLFFIMIIPKNSVGNENKIRKKTLLTYLFYNLLLLISTSFVIGVLGIDLALLYQYPDYHMLRTIQAGGFIQRTESILAVQWVLCLFMMIGFCVYYCLQTIATIFPKPEKHYRKYLYFIIPILSLILSLNIFPNNTAANNFILEEFPYIIAIFTVPLPFILLIVNYWKNSKKKHS